MQKRLQKCDTRKDNKKFWGMGREKKATVKKRIMLKKTENAAVLDGLLFGNVHNQVKR